VFGAKSAEVTEKKQIEFWRVPKSAQTIDSKGPKNTQQRMNVKSAQIH
jgi:hypothetical protein